MINFLTIISILPIAMMVGSARKNIVENTRVDVWYEYTGPQTEAGYRVEANYTKFQPQPTDMQVRCPGSDILCAIKAPDNGIHPATFSSAFETAIISAVQTNVETANIELKQ